MLPFLAKFFLAGGLFQLASAFALHFGVRVPEFMRQRSAFGQLCQGTALLFIAQASAASEGNVVVWVTMCLAPLLFAVGLLVDLLSRRDARRGSRTRTRTA
jgi:predicted histidine transporter YuiF (NhaC family)